MPADGNDTMTLSKKSGIAVGSTLALTALGVLTHRLLQPDSQLLGHTVVAGTDPNELAFTYDDGPNDRSTLELLDLFERFRAKATFFMMGSYVRQRPEIARAVHDAGHLVGNHTMTHPFLADKTLAFVRDQVRGCTETLEDTLGAPIRYFRAPYGARRPAVLRVVRELGLIPVQWNVHGNDWDPIGAEGILQRLDRRMERVRRKGYGVNLLLHDGFDKSLGADRSASVCATEVLLAQAKQQGRRVLTVDAWD